MKLSNKMYDVLKWVVIIVLPAISALYSGLAGVWDWPYAEQIVSTISCITVFLGAVLGFSSAKYKSSTLDEEAM
uniref:Holin n=1 Tax=Podoviridae sp. ctiJY10 TaxID=2826572 RepID=A0A8S5N4J4_9CAUD|nr:MAG TPA: holin [Podoviridae sp. ctiJY10]